MADPSLLEVLAARVLDVEPDASEDEVKSAYRDKVKEWHPDVSDVPNAEEKFIAAQAARDILTGDLDFGDKDEVNDAQNQIFNLFSEEEIDEVQAETDATPSYTGEAKKRADPEGFGPDDFAGVGAEARQEMMERLALGVETTIIYQAVEGLYKQGYRRDDFFHDINEYIEKESPGEVTFDDYYEATKDSLREGISERVFKDTIEKVQQDLQEEYGDGATVREVGRIVSYFMAQGGINLGHVGRFVGSSPFGRHDAFGSRDVFGKKDVFKKDRRFNR